MMMTLICVVLFMYHIMAIDSPFLKNYQSFFPHFLMCVSSIFYGDYYITKLKKLFFLNNNYSLLHWNEILPSQKQSKKNHYYDSHSCVLFISFCAKKHIVLLTYNTPSSCSHLTKLTQIIVWILKNWSNL